MATVLWGQHRGDTIYGSVDWRRRNIPFGDPVLTVESNAYFDVRGTVQIGSALYTITGKEPGKVGVRAA